MKYFLLYSVSILLFSFSFSLAKDFEKDTIQTSKGNLEITFVGHATLMFKIAGKIIHIDPVSRQADYSQMPKADLILITHEHGDHLDPAALKEITTDKTTLILTAACYRKYRKGKVIGNEEKTSWNGIQIEALPAYNLVHKRKNGAFFHPKGVGNSYLLTIGDKRIYIGGDTENIPEMKVLKQIDIAFLPMNLPYTMTPEMVADAALAFKPKILYPYHYGKTDPQKLVALLKDHPEIEVRVRQMQ